MHVLSGFLLFLPLQSSLPQSWHGFWQNARPPLPLHSLEPHFTQCRMRLCAGPESGSCPSIAENGRFIEADCGAGGGGPG